MAGYRGHLTGATIFCGVYLAGIAAVYTVDAAYERFSLMELVVLPVVLFGLALMFGLFPDVDTHSKGRKLFYRLFFLVDVLLIVAERYEEAAYLGLLALLPAIGKHRGWTHTWWAMLLVPLPLLVVPYATLPERPLAGLPFYGAAVVGYLSHLVLDGTLFARKKRRRG